MLKGEDIKRLVKNAENWQVEFKLAKGGVPIHLEYLIHLIPAWLVGGGWR